MKIKNRKKIKEPIFHEFNQILQTKIEVLLKTERKELKGEGELKVTLQILYED